MNSGTIMALIASMLIADAVNAASAPTALQADTSLDLLALVDLKQDTVAGEWKLKDKHLYSPGTPDAKLAFPVRPSGDYQFTVKFKRPEGSGGPILCLPVGERHVNFALDGYGGQFTALEAIDGAFVDNPGNPSQVKGKHIVTGKSHSLEATVLMKGDTATIRVDLDGKELVNWTGKSNRLSLHPAWRLNDDRQLGLRSWQGFEFETAQLRMLTGQANPIRESVPGTRPMSEQGNELTGVWKAGGATFYVRQLGKEIWWLGEHSPTNPRWTNVARGAVDNKLVHVKWVDVPKGATRGEGTLTLRIVDARHMTIEENPNDFWVWDWVRQ